MLDTVHTAQHTFYPDNLAMLPAPTNPLSLTVPKRLTLPLTAIKS